MQIRLYYIDALQQLVANTRKYHAIKRYMRDIFVVVVRATADGEIYYRGDAYFPRRRLRS